MTGEASGRVMIVDDDPVIQQLMLSSLETQGCEVVCVGSGAEAIALALGAPPDIILLDVLLPDIDGIAVCRRIRAEPLLAELPVIMITALHEADVRLGSLEAGADDFIAKPVDFLELRARVGSILRLNRYRQLLNERTQRQRAEDEILRRNRDLMLLNSFIIATASRLHTPNQIEDILSDACGVLVQTFGLAQARVRLTLDDGETLTAAAPPGDPPALRLAGAGSLYAAPAAPGGDALPALLPVDPIAAPCASGQGPLTLPIQLSGRTSGEFTLLAAGDRVFDGQERAFAQSLVGAVGQAIEAALLHRQLQRHVDTLEEIVAKRTDELLAERDRTQAILEALGEAVIVTDADWTIRYVNPATTDLTGYESSFLAGLRWSDLQATGGTAHLYRLIGEQVRTGQTWRGEITGVRHDGSRYDAAMTVAPIFDPLADKGPVGLVSIQRDISPLKAAERLKERFVSNVSHELRTPLSIIALHSGNLDTLYDRLGDDRRRHLIREVRAQAALLDDLIGDVLELSRIDSGSLPTDSHPLDLAELLGREVALLLPLAERSGLALELEAGDPVYVCGDEAQLRQCIRNLISNAIKFTPAGGSISCACRTLGDVPEAEWPSSAGAAPGPWAGLRVVDSGIGIDPAHLPHLFERFYRVQNQTNVPGTGLGLAITSELVTRHGGWTAVASTLRAGSTFAFYLPVVQPD